MTSPFNPLTHPDKIDKKELIIALNDFFSIPIDETEQINPTTGLPDYFYEAKGVSIGPRTAKYMVNLKRGLSQCIKLSHNAHTQFSTENNLGVWGDLYLAPSSIFSRDRNIGKNMIGVPVQKSAGGDYGNVAKAFFTPHVPDLCKAEILKQGFITDEKLWNCKLLSASQIDTIIKAEIHLIFTNNDNATEGDSFQLDIGDLSESDVDIAVQHFRDKGLRPVRLLFKNVPKELAIMYNPSTINENLDVLQSGRWEKGSQPSGRIPTVLGEIDKYIASQTTPTDQILAIKAGKLKEQYGINIGEHITSTLGNHLFYLIKDQQGFVRRLFAFQKIKSFFIYPEKSDPTQASLNSGSFVEARLSNTGRKKVTVTQPDRTSEIPFEFLSFENVLDFNNWEGITKIKQSTGSRFYFFDFLATEINALYFKSSLEALLRNTQMESSSLDDDSVENELLKIAEDSPIFKVNKYKTDNYLSNHKVVFKSSSDVNIEFYERYQQHSYSTSVVESNDLNWISIRKSDTSFEREKVLTVLFMHHRAAFLKAEGHSNIRFVLEYPVKKYTVIDGSSTGYLDLGVFSTDAQGKRLGQLYEFKAWSHLTTQDQNKIDAQANNYNVDCMISGNHEQLDGTHNGSPVNQVLGINLNLSNIRTLSQTPIQSAKKIRNACL